MSEANESNPHVTVLPALALKNNSTRPTRKQIWAVALLETASSESPIARLRRRGQREGFEREVVPCALASIRSHSRTRLKTMASWPSEFLWSATPHGMRRPPR